MLHVAWNYQEIGQPSLKERDNLTLVFKTLVRHENL